MDNDRKDKDLLSGEEAPESEKPRGGIEGRYRSAQPDPASPSADEEALSAQETPEGAETAADEDAPDDVMIPSPLEKKTEKKKRKKKKLALPLLITLGVFVLLFVGYAVMVLVIPERTVNKEDPLIKEYVTLVNYTADQITDIDFTYRDGYAYTLNLSRYVNEAGYNTTVYSVAGKGEFAYDQEAFSRMVAQIVEISSGTLANQAADLSIYGLDDPKVTITYHIFDENGMSTEGITLKVGNAAPIGSGHYGMLDGDDRIYVIGYAEADYLVSKDYDYRDLKLLTVNDYINDIQSVAVHRGPDDDLVVARATDEEKHALEYATTYRIYEPALVNCNTYYLETNMLQYITVLYAESVVEDYPRDLSVYGLSEADDPMEVGITTVDGEFTRFTLAKTRNEDGTIYGKVNGMTSVFTFDPALFEFAYVTYNQLLDMTIWLYEFNDLDHIDMMLAGEKHTLYIEKNGDAYSTKLDELEIDETDARQLYARMLQIYLDDITRKDDVAGEVEYSIFLYGRKGDVRSLELAAINDRRFIVILDGVEQEYYVRYNTFKFIMDGINDLYEGLHLTYTI